MIAIVVWLDARRDTVLGSFETNDGVLTVVNPDL
jgi:hypothetical protein